MGKGSLMNIPAKYRNYIYIALAGVLAVLFAAKIVTPVQVNEYVELALEALTIAGLLLAKLNVYPDPEA